VNVDDASEPLGVWPIVNGVGRNGSGSGEVESVGRGTKVAVLACMRFGGESPPGWVVGLWDSGRLGKERTGDVLDGEDLDGEVNTVGGELDKVDGTREEERWRGEEGCDPATSFMSSLVACDPRRDALGAASPVVSRSARVVASASPLSSSSAELTGSWSSPSSCLVLSLSLPPSGRMSCWRSRLIAGDTLFERLRHDPSSSSAGAALAGSSWVDWAEGRRGPNAQCAEGGC
jgi:hypothetical protein